MISLSSLLCLSLVPEKPTQSTVARRIRSTPAIPRSGKGTSTTSDRRLACLGPDTLSERAKFAQNLQHSRGSFASSSASRPATVRPPLLQLRTTLGRLRQPRSRAVEAQRAQAELATPLVISATSAAVELRPGYHPSVLPCLSSL